MNENQHILIDAADNDEIDIKSAVEKYLFYWRWILLGIVLGLIAAFLYMRYTTHIYEATASILIDDKEKSGLASEVSAFSDIGIFGNVKASLDTEMGVLKSRTLLEDMVKELGINVVYFEDAKIRDDEQYGENVPVKINFLVKDSLLYKLDTSFVITPVSKEAFTIGGTDTDTAFKRPFGKNVKTTFGEINVTPTNLQDVHIGEAIVVRIMPLEDVVKNYRERITIKPDNKKSSLLVLSLEDPVPQKAADILNTLVALYNSNAVTYKKMIAENTDKFINERIRDISAELENVDKGVEEFKRKNKVTNISMEAGIDLSSNSELRKRITELNSQIKMVDFVIKHIKNNPDVMIPANLGLNDSKTNENTSMYNKLLMERNRIMKSSRKLNPTVINLENQLAGLRASIEQGLKNLKSSLTFSLNEAQNQMYRLNVKKGKTPVQERELQDIMRKQQIIESLYLYLLQKREENAISLGIPVPNAKIIDAAKSTRRPVSPKSTLVYFVGLVLGFLIPVLIISIKLLFDTKVHTREDVERLLKAPVAGEIPAIKSKEKLVLSLKGNNNVAEAFRLFRTNLMFMLPKKSENKAKTVFITSTIGSEGKTFVSINLGISLALMNKKVLIIGADIRKPKIGNYLDLKSETGLSEFLSDDSINPDKIIKKHKNTGVDVILSGAIPPNPSELLINGRFKELLTFVRDRYDYIIVDTAPVSVVTDTLILGELADLVVYVVKAEFLDKRSLKYAQLLYENKRLPNMAVLINGINIKKQRYSYGYGYGYES